MKPCFRWLYCIAVLCALAGCATGPTYVTRVDRTHAVSETDEFVVGVDAIDEHYNGYEGLAIALRNKTDSVLEIDWNRTLFIVNGQTNGGFMFAGMAYANKDAPKLPDMVGPRQDFAKTMWPSVLVYFASGEYGGWRHRRFNQGDIGVSLSVKVDGREVRSNVFVRLSQVLSSP